MALRRAGRVLIVLRAWAEGPSQGVHELVMKGRQWRRQWQQEGREGRLCAAITQDHCQHQGMQPCIRPLHSWDPRATSHQTPFS